MRRRRPLVLAALGALAAVAACTLNPQPLPPQDDHFGGGAEEDAGSSFGTFSDSGRNDKQTEPSPSDAAAGGADATPATEGDAGDAGDDCRLAAQVRRQHEKGNAGARAKQDAGADHVQEFENEIKH